MKILVEEVFIKYLIWKKIAKKILLNKFETMSSFRADFL